MNSRSEGPFDLSGCTPGAVRRIGVFALTILTLTAILFSARQAVAEPSSEKFKQATVLTAPWLSKVGMETPFMKVGVQSEPGIEGLIEKIRSGLPEEPKLRISALFTNNFDRRFLVTEWKTGKIGVFSDHILLHRVSYPSGEKVRLLYLDKEIENIGTTLKPPSGYPLAPGENPVMVVAIYLGGNGPATANLRLVVLDDMPVDVTPEWVEVRYNLRDLNGDGAMELTGSLIEWDDEVPECDYSCNSTVPVIVAWRKQKWLPSCREFAKSHREILASNEALIEYRKKEKYDKPWIVRALAFQALSYAQIGDHETAWRYGMEAAEVSGRPDHPLLPFLKKARSLGNYQCPASAAKSADPHWRVR